MKKENKSRYSFAWKIDDFTIQLQNAKHVDSGVRLFSEPFYTHVGGYRIKLRLHPNGYGIGKGTHVTAGMAIMKGKFDAVLTWHLNGNTRLLSLTRNQTRRKEKMLCIVSLLI